MSDDLHDDEKPIRPEAYGYFRDEPLDAAARKAICKQLPDGAELVEGDFADDEKWRIVSPEQAPPELAIVEPDDPVEIGTCAKCGGPVREHEPRIQDKRGHLYHPDCYSA